MGGAASRPVDVRIVAATNRDLKKMIGEGAFREDLYYRLSVIDIVIPPLRERKEDILPLAEYFLRISTEDSGPKSRGSPRGPWLSSWPTPGPGTCGSWNSLERAALLSGHKMLEPEDFPLALEHYLGLAEEKHRGDGSSR